MKKNRALLVYMLSATCVNIRLIGFTVGKKSMLDFGVEESEQLCRNIIQSLLISNRLCTDSDLIYGFEVFTSYFLSLKYR